MPKINLPELNALAEYVTGKVPRLGMFSTLKGLIENSPRDTMTAQEWSGYLKPGQIASREGVEFPLKKEELEYADLPNFLGSFNPGDKLTRDQLMGQYMTEAPKLNALILGRQGMSGSLPEQALESAGHIGNLPERLEVRDPQHSAYSHAGAGGEGGLRTPLGEHNYQVSVTTSPDIGKSGSHFSDQDISWSRTNQVPMDPYDINSIKENQPQDYQGRLMRLIEEIQSDRHQKAIKESQFTTPMAPEVLNRVNQNLRELSQQYGNRSVQSAVNAQELNPADWSDELHPLINDPRLAEVRKLMQSGKGKVGYQPSDVEEQLQKLSGQINEINNTPPYLSYKPGFGLDLAQDPELQDRLKTLRVQRDMLRNAIPDTPFKTTQGYTGLEMRKALNDALQSGDQSLGLVTGNDQNAFYGRRFNENQTTGQNYAYNKTYPPVLEKLAKQYGFPYGPQTAHLFPVQMQEQEQMWPPARMRTNQMEHPEYETPDLETFNAYVLNPEYVGPGYEANTIARMFESLSRHIPAEHAAEMNLFRGDADQPSLRDQFNKHIGQMSRARNEISDLEYRANDDEDLEKIKDSPEYLALVQKANEGRAGAWPILRQVFDKYKEIYDKPSEAAAVESTPKTFQNAIDLSNPDLVERARKAGVPIWALAGVAPAGAMLAEGQREADQDTGAEHAEGGVIHSALQRIGFPGGGKVNVIEHITQLISDYINHLHDMNRLPPEQLTDAHVEQAHQLQQALTNQGIDPNFLVDRVMQEAKPDLNVTEHAEGGSIDDDHKSSLAKLSNALGYLGPDVKRVGTRVAQQFYGLDSSGQPALGGRAWTEEQGGTPMSLLDQITAAPGSIAKIYDLLKNTAMDNLIPGGIPEAYKDVVHSITDITSPKFSDDAAARLDALNQKVGQSTGVGDPHGLRENIEDMGAALLTPIPMSAAAKEANVAEHAVSPLRTAMEFVAPVRPPIKRLPLDATVLGGANTALQSKLGDQQPHAPLPEEVDLHRYMLDHMSHSPDPDELVTGAVNRAQTPDQGMADGGQPQQPAAPDPTATPPAPNEDSLLNDMIQRRLLRGMPYGGGGKVGIAERLAELLSKLTGDAEHVAPAAPVAPATSPVAKVPQGINPDYAAEIQRRNWAADASPTDIFKQVTQTNPAMEEHAAEILSRGWTPDHLAGGGTPNVAAMLTLLKSRLVPTAPQFGVHASFQHPETPSGGQHQYQSLGGDDLFARSRGLSPNSQPLADGGQPDFWEQLKARLHALQKPLIEGPPPKTVAPPPVVESDDDIDRHAALNHIMEMMGRQSALSSGVDSESGPYGHLAPEALAALQKKFAGTED